MPATPSIDFALQFKHLIRQLDVVAIFDIALVATAIYYLLLLAKGSRAMQVLKGLAILLAVMKLAQWLGMDTLYWFISQALFASAVVLVILFQPELRAALDQLGRTHLEVFGFKLQSQPATPQSGVVEEVTRAIEGLSQRKIGALIALEREVGLDDVAATGTPLNARLSAELLEAIFQPGNPLHDGGVVLKGEEVVAAACILPLSNNDQLPRTVGTRHRAALGLSETTDALILVVSEESGKISVAREGTMNTILQPRLLVEELRSILGRDEGTARLRPFARSVGKVAVNLPRETIGSLRAAMKRS